MLRRLLALAITGATLLAILSMQGTTAAEGDIYGNRSSYAAATALQIESVGGNRLINGDFDQLPFYWRPTNHYVAGMWFEWWVDGTTIAEYIDGGGKYHNECYPMPAGGKCRNDDTGEYNSSQGYILYKVDHFKAGIYQPVENLERCTLYRFEMYNRNDTDRYGAQVAIEPGGWVITRLSTTNLKNCPPDGQSVCPYPRIDAEHDFPDTIIWSEPSYHEAYTWAPLSVTAEAIADKISVWTYAAPDDSSVSQSTYWDYGSLVQMPFPDGKLPAPSLWTPSGYVQIIDAPEFITPTLTIEWTTSDPSSTQIFYSITPSVITPTDSMTHTVFMPMIHQPDRQPYLDTTPTTSHQATITGLKVGDVVKFIALSRRVLGTSCATETSLPYGITIGSGQLVVLDNPSAEAAALYAGQGSP